jgi:hypothetical protein
MLLKSKTDCIYCSTILVMYQPSTSLVIVKPTKVQDKGDGQSSYKPVVVEPAFDFRLQFTTDRKFYNVEQMQPWVCKV